MLEAWENADKIWYQYIWEEIREPSNIVEYNINKEITKDASNVINANNDTTTWMATLIYWVNAPKLLEKTSVYRNTVIQWQSTLVFTHTLYRDGDNALPIRTATITKNYWNITFENKKIEVESLGWNTTERYNWVVVPFTWEYQLEITFPTGSGTGRTEVTTQIKKINWKSSRSEEETIAQYTNGSVYPHTETINYFFNAWDTFYVFDSYWGTAPAASLTCTTTIVITLL